MSEMIRDGGPFVGYDYKETAVRTDMMSRYLDGYMNFGWMPEGNEMAVSRKGITILRMKRDRKIINKVELTRLQQHFEACMEDAGRLERSRTKRAAFGAILTGLAGTAFIAGSTFAVTNEPPIIWLCVILAVPGFAGWTAPCFLYKYLVRRRVKQIEPLLERKYEEIYEICEKGSSLCNR